MTGSRPGLDWPTPPEITEPQPPDSRRAWGKLPYEERYRKQRRDLLRAAARIASRRGYQGTRIADIVAEAGLSKGTFYEHFTSKEDCFLDLYRRTNAGMLRAGIAAAEATFERGAYETILAVVRALTGYASQNPRLAQALGTEFGAAHPAIAAERAENTARVVELFVVVANRLGSQLPADELRLAATILVHGVTSILGELRRRSPSFDRDLEAIARVGCRGLGVEDRS